MPYRWHAWGVLGLLAALAVIPYLPFARLPHISDDYLQIDLGRRWGPVAAWPALFSDALYRCRATSIVLTHYTEAWFGSQSALLLAESVALHLANTLLIAALGWWKAVGWPAAAVAAGFFAVYEGHQEAVVWYAALPELLVFFFAMLALHAWLRWAGQPRGGAGWYAGALAAFAFALLSKESAVAAVPLLAGAAWWAGARPARVWVAALAPFALLAALYAAAIFAAKQTHLHLNDGTFSLEAPVAAIVARSSFRLLWVWGLAALALLAWRRRFVSWQVPAASLVWIAVTLLPYSFLLYMPRVPSRHVYWASAGLAFLFAAASLAAWQRWRSAPAMAALAAVVVVHNCGWLWWKKLPQYERRAAPTEKLVEFAERVPGKITVKCFPYGHELALLALRMRAGRAADEVAWNPQAPTGGTGVYCDTEQP